MVASQDLSPEDAGKRVGEWAVLARPGAEVQQVAQLMGVTPQADPGQPIRLALGDVTAPAQMALTSADAQPVRSVEHKSELQTNEHLVCSHLIENNNTTHNTAHTS